jgi:hypothetical protein
VLARGDAIQLAARESQVRLASVSRQNRAPAGKAAAISVQRLRVVLKNIVASESAPPYDVFLIGSPSVGATSVRIGALDLFGGAGRGKHAQRGGDTIAFEASEAVAQLSRTRGFEIRDLRVVIVRRGFPDATGGEFVPPDPDPPRIGAVELIQS